MHRFTEDQITNLQGFLNSLYCNVAEGFIELRFFCDKKKESVFVHVADRNQLFTCIENHLSNYNCYFGVTIRGSQINGKKENCQFLTALWSDVDYGIIGHKKPSYFSTREDALKHISRIPFSPSAIVDSGHGLHLYWILDYPITLTAESIKLVEGLMATIRKVVGGDSTHNVDRILRIPHTFNMKEEHTKECVILSLDAENKYSFSYIENLINTDPLFSIPWNRINQEYYDLLFGGHETEPEDRSAIDQKIITYLKTIGFTDLQIKTIFDHFPTTGKYWERRESDPKGAESYLSHSINKSKDYIMNSSTRISPTDLDFKDFFEMRDELQSIGYYIDSPDSKKRKNRLNNFIIFFNKQIKSVIDRQPSSKLDGVLKLEDGMEIEIKSMHASLLANPQKFKEFMLNLAGTRVSFYGNTTMLLEAIKFFNKNIEIHEALEFGYDEGLTMFITPEHIIHADTIEYKKTPILHSENWGQLDLGFIPKSEKPLDVIRKEILHELLTWDKSMVMFYIFGFTMLPVIHPFLLSELRGKPYLMLQGVTGCGKTALSRLQFSFYSLTQAITSITSTHTAINVIGHSLKDVLFIVDDVKASNVNEYEMKRYTATIQNYYDGNSRQRSNTSLEIKDPKHIRGFLQLTAEDIIIEEPSAIARGIIVPMEKKKIDTQRIKKLNNLSPSFNHFTLKLIQHLLSIKDKQYFTSVLQKNVKFFESIITNSFVSADNLPRLVNNFALVKTSWDIALDFLLPEDERDNKCLYDAEFDHISVELFESNLERLLNIKPEERFEETMWTMVEANLVHFTNTCDPYPLHNLNEIGTYQIKEDGSVKIGLKFSHAFKLVNEYLRNQGGLGISQSTLKTSLEKTGKIISVPTGRVTIGSETFRGVYWAGEISFESLGINRPLESVGSDSAESKTAKNNDDRNNTLF